MKRGIAYRAGRIGASAAAWLVCACVVFTAAAGRSAPAQAVADNSAPAIDNERVTVWEIALTPGRPTSLPHPDDDFVTMLLVGSKVHSVDGGGVTMRNSGDVVYTRKGAGKSADVISDEPARLVIVELKDHPVPPVANTTKYPAAFPRPHSRKVFDNDRIIVWDYTWTPGVPTPMHFHDKDVVVAYRDDGSLQSTTPDGKSVVNDYKAGSLYFNKANRTHFEKLVKGQQSAMIIELK